MEREGPPLEQLTRRLAETPEDFLAAPRIGSMGTVEVAAVVGDLAHLLGGGQAGADVLTAFNSTDARRDRNRFCVVLVLCWLLSDDWFRRDKPDLNAVWPLLSSVAGELAGSGSAGRFVADADRREELARVALSRLGCRPAGETVAQAQDRLARISSSERTRVVQAARAAEERARSIREALARKAAEEAADKAGRE